MALIADMTFVGGGNVLNSTIYGHDKAGNRLFSRIEQVGHKNDRSYLYEYDRLHRLVQAGRGMLMRTAWATPSQLKPRAVLVEPGLLTFVVRQQHPHQTPKRR